MAFTSFSQDCNIGHWDTSNPDFTIGNFTADYLVGVNFTLSQVGVLHSLNMIGNGSVTSFRMAIYDDNGSAPNNLIAYTDNATVGTGIVTLPITPVQLEAGDYWIMANYNAAGNHSNVNHVDQSSVVYYTELLFGDPIPTNASAFETYNGQDFLYFAEISCGPLSVNDFEENKFSVLPNPASDYIFISNLKENTTLEIYDLTGKKLMEKEVSVTNNEIDISSHAAGTYLVNIGTSTISKFVKN